MAVSTTCHPEERSDEGSLQAGGEVGARFRDKEILRCAQDDKTFIPPNRLLPTARPPYPSRMIAPVLPSWTTGVRREVLPNGLTVLVQRDRSAPVAAVVTHVKAGFFDEPDEWAGISHVLEHMFFKGTPSRGVGQIAKETKAAGGYLNASTTYDHTSYFAVLPAAQLREAVTIQADALMHAAIDADELRRELQVIIQEAKRKLDHPGAVTQETLHEVMYDHHRIRRSSSVLQITGFICVM